MRLQRRKRTDEHFVFSSVFALDIRLRITEIEREWRMIDDPLTDKKAKGSEVLRYETCQVRRHSSFGQATSTRCRTRCAPAPTAPAAAFAIPNAGTATFATAIVVRRAASATERVSFQIHQLKLRCFGN